MFESNETNAYVLTYISIAFWGACTLLHVLVLIINKKLESMDCDTPLQRFVKTTPISFHANSLVGDLLRTVVSVVLLRALCAHNTDLLVNFLRYKYVELFQLLILFAISCFGNQTTTLVKAYFIITLALDVALMHVIFHYCCELLSSK
ncbi:uncharacterized protein [Eurosta solidaginis]|uniref:uncharacterized protein n=1 Tax=Eurosta solidaginis TaxID=178769 RepID=UPI0035313369